MLSVLLAIALALVVTAPLLGTASAQETPTPPGQVSPTAQPGGIGSGPDTPVALVSAVLAFVGGGLAGSLVNSFFSRRQQRTQVALKVIDSYLAQYSELGHVKWLLRPTVPVDNQEMNRIRSMGDWFNITALLCQKNLADRKLLQDIGITDEAKEFYNLVRDKSKEELSTLQDTLKVWIALRQH